MADSPRCSSFLDAPLPGTAGVERGWLLIESDGGWGRDVFDGDAFVPAVRAAIRSFGAHHGLRVLLIRRPGGGRAGRAERLVFHADSVTGTLRRHVVADYSEVPKLNLMAGEDAEPIIAVCTHGKRDVCCAIGGRPIAAALAPCYVDPVVWECSHTGGHRFAPVLIVLPTGYTYGRMDGAGAKRAFDAARAGKVLPEGLRGRSTLAPIGQVAEVAVRQLLGTVAIDALRIEVDGAGDLARVTHTDGRRWSVRAQADPLPPRPASCGKADKSAQGWRITALEEHTRT